MTMCVCNRFERGTKQAREQARKDGTDWECSIVATELMNGRVAEEMTEQRKEVRRARRAANPTGTETGTKEALETKAKARARAKADIAMTHRRELPIRLDQQTRRRRGLRPEGEKAEEPESLGALDDEGEWCWPERNRITRW